ncbi:MAG: acetylxylan esterase [Tannerellaceae bacterium]|nr:acetylxylan esterase [Tannerellaceae bacterium]
MRTSWLLTFCLLFGCCGYTVAQRTNIKDYVRVEIVPDHDDWTYRVREKARFILRVIRGNVPLKNVPLKYEIGPEKMPAVLSGQSDMAQGVLTIEAGTMKEPGFLTCTCTTEVDGLTYTNYLNIAFDPENIQPTTTLPADFKDFWDRALAESGQIPMEPLITLMPEGCTPRYNMYHVRFQHYKKGSYIYGTLTIPTRPGRYPAVLRIPGAGIKKNRPELEMAEMQDVITFSIGIHGILQTQDAAFYDNLRYGVMADYAFFLLDSKEHYYYRRIVTGCVRSVDFLFTLPEFDGENIGLLGASQGAGLSLMTAGLDHRIKAMAVYHPALCDHTGYLHGHAGGWPHLFAPQNAALNNKPEKIETSKYYDAVNFSRFIQAPCFFTWGFNDQVCTPTSYYAAYNVVTASKRLYVAHEQLTGVRPNRISGSMAGYMIC